MLPERTRVCDAGSGAAAAVRPRPRPRPRSCLGALPAGPRPSPEMASAAAPAAPSLAPPLEQLRQLAGDLRLLLPGVRGERTPLGRATVGTGLGREEAQLWRGSGGGRAGCRGGRPGGGGGEGAGARAVRSPLLFLPPPPAGACPPPTHPPSGRSPGDGQGVPPGDVLEPTQ